MNDSFNFLKKIRESNIYKSQAGQMLLIFALTWMIFAGGILSVYNVGTLVGERIRLQNAADNAAYSGAVWEARGLNYIAYSNRTIIAELSFLSWLCALTSCVQAWRKLAGYLKMIPFPPVSAAFSAIEGVLTVIENIMLVVVEDIPWKYMPQGIGMLQKAMKIFLQTKVSDVMDTVGSGFKSHIGINDVNFPGIAFGLYDVNNSNHDNVLKEGKWQGLQKVLKATISRYTKGTFSGGIPIYNRSFEVDIPPLWRKIKIPGVTGAVISMSADCEIKKDKVTCNDGPGVKVGTWAVDKDLDLYISWWLNKSFDLGDVSAEIDLDDINYYVFNQEKNKSVGVYAVAHKLYSNISDIVYFDIAGLFGAPENHMLTMAKARAVYQDPVLSSKRHTALSGANLEPNMFNPFWKAELVPLEANDNDDADPDKALTLITSVMKGFEGFLSNSGIAFKRH